jgi:hypothetical protein
MAAVVAPHHTDLWHRRPEHSLHISDMHFTGMMPPYHPQRTTTTTSSMRGLPSTTTHMEISMPLFSANVLATSVPYPSGGVYAYDSVNPYNMQQNSIPHNSMSQSYSMNYAPNMSPAVSFAEAAAPRPLSTVREVQPAFAMDGSHVVKSESASPVQSQSAYNDASYAPECKRSGSEPTDTTGINFATDVDTLMKAIQAKQTASPQQQEAPKVSLHRSSFGVTCADSCAAPGAKGHPEAEEEVPMPYARLQQELLPENTSGDTHSGSHWRKAICKSTYAVRS